MHFTCRSFIGHPSDNSWSQFWENEPDNQDIISRRGHLFGLINLSSTNSQANILGHQLISQINESYFSDLKNQITIQLKNTLTNLTSLPEYQSMSLNLILAVVANQKLYLAIFNSGRCLLRRQNQISPILVGTTDSIVTISGAVADGDQLLLCTDEFFNDFSWEKIKSFLSLDKLEELEESFLSHMYSLENQSTLAAALIQIHQESSSSETVIGPQSTLPVVSSKPLFKFKFPSFPRPVYVVHSDPPSASRRKRLNILLSLIILVALLISSYFGYRRNFFLQQEKQYQTLKSELDTKINHALTVKNLNLDTAFSLAQESKQILEKMTPYKTTHDSEITKYQTEVTRLLSQTGSTDSFVPTIFYDTSLIDNHLSYSRLTLSGSHLYLLDVINGRIDELDLSQKSHQNLIKTADLQGSQFISANNDSVYLLKDAQIFLVSDQEIKSKITFHDQIADFSTGEFQFWNGSLYFLSLGTSEASIWKYTPSGTGFSSGQKWLKTGNSLPSNPTSLAINGDIWVISQTGQIAVYSLGLKKEFKVTSTNTFTQVDNLVTSADSNILAFTDNGNQVYTYDKNGQSTGHYNFGNRKILSLAYDQTSNIILVLCEDQKIYQINL